MSRSLVLFVVASFLLLTASAKFVGMPAPRILYSCVVRNVNFSTPVEVTVTYKHPFTKEPIAKTAQLIAGSEKKFERINVEEDTAVYSAGIDSITFKTAGVNAFPVTISHKDIKMTSPTSNYLVEIISDERTNSGFRLVQHNMDAEAEKNKEL